MRAMLLEHTSQICAGSEPLRFADIPIPVPSAGELLIRVTCCGVCHTEMDEIEGRATPPTLPVIPGHQVIGHVVENRSESKRLAIGDRVGVCWIFSACGECSQCQSGHENLCPDFRATGKDEHGGYAEYMRVPEAFALPIPEAIDNVTAAPLLCAGAIGYRSMRLAQLSSATQLGFSGFGVSARQVLALVPPLSPGCTLPCIRSQSGRTSGRARSGCRLGR